MGFDRCRLRKLVPLFNTTLVQQFVLQNSNLKRHIKNKLLPLAFVHKTITCCYFLMSNFCIIQQKPTLHICLLENTFSKVARQRQKLFWIDCVITIYSSSSTSPVGKISSSSSASMAAKQIGMKDINGPDVSCFL